MTRRLDPLHLLGIPITAPDLGIDVYGVDLGRWEVSDAQWLEITRRFREAIACRLGWPKTVLTLSQGHHRVLYEYRPANSQEDLEACHRFGDALQAAEEYAFRGVDRPRSAYLDVKVLH